MKVRTMRLVDRLLGVPACALFTTIRRLGPGDGRPGGPAVRKILFVKLVEQGTTVLARAAFEAAAARVGREHVYCLTLEETRDISLRPDRRATSSPCRGRRSRPRAACPAVAPRARRRRRRRGPRVLRARHRGDLLAHRRPGARGLHQPGRPWRGDSAPVLLARPLHRTTLRGARARARPAARRPCRPTLSASAAGHWRDPLSPRRKTSGARRAPRRARARPLPALPPQRERGDLEPLRRWRRRYVELARALAGVPRRGWSSRGCRRA
jgi:hypothetical protein